MAVSYAFKTECALVFVPYSWAIHRLLRTDFYTSVAVITSVRFERELWLPAPGFGVLTPVAAQWAAFEEDNGAYAGSVMQTEMLH